MARGQQAVQAQQKNAKRKEKARKAARNKGTSQPGVLNAAAAAKSAKCKICMQLMQQLAADKPGSLKPLTAHVGKHKGKAMVDCFPDWTPEAIELKLNPTAAADAAIEPYDEYSAEVAVKAYAIEERKAAIEETGGKDVWKSKSWMQRYNIMNPKEVVFKADKEIKGKKKQSHKRN